MSDEPTTGTNSTRYRKLGLTANPFKVEGDRSEWVLDTAVASEAHRLLRVIDVAAGQERPKPICVKKGVIPSAYPLRAMSDVEHELTNDDSLGILHAYVPFFMLHTGRVRSTLGVVGERLAFRSFDRTLVAYVDRILQEPDESLISYGVLRDDRLQAFAERFRRDSAAAITAVFGEPEVERRPELAVVSDFRLTGLEVDVDDEGAASPELDSSVGDAPGTAVVLAEEADEREEDHANAAVLDYLVEHTKAHLSPVIARALRVYRERGLGPMSGEFRITKAPRKTLAALVKLAQVRFRKVAIIYDGFDAWDNVPGDLKGQITTSLGEIRWLLDGDAVIVMMLENDGAAELEEQFGGGTRMDWDFGSVRKAFEAPDVLDTDVIAAWLEAAATPGAAPLTTDDPVLAELVRASGTSLKAFIGKGHAAVENAAERGVAQLDDGALAAGLAAEPEEAPAS